MYNESSIIKRNSQLLHEYLSDNFEHFELIFIDDGSTDNSAQIVKDLNLSNTKVISYKPNHGKGHAVRIGMMECSGDIAMFIDSDLAYGTNVISEAVSLLKDNPDKSVLVGSRVKHPQGYDGYTFMRKVASKLYIKILNIFGGLKLSDSQCGCKAYRGKAIKDIFSRCETDGFAFDFETILIAQKLNYSFLEMPVKIVNHRESKVRLIRDSLEMLIELKAIKKRVKLI